VSKHNYGLSGAGVQMIWNYNFVIPMRRKSFPQTVFTEQAIRAFRGTASYDSPDVDILKKLQEEGTNLITLDYPEENIIHE